MKIRNKYVVHLDKEQRELIANVLEKDKDFENVEHLIRCAIDMYCLDYWKC